MAAIYKRKLKGGKHCTWRAVIRIPGFPTVCKTFERKQEAEDWAPVKEGKIEAQKFKFDIYKKQHTYEELMERMEGDGVLNRQHSYQKTKSPYRHWKERLGSYALIHITHELINQERQHLTANSTPQ